MILEECLGDLSRLAVLLAHFGQRLVQRLDRKVDLGKELGDLRMLLLERRGHSDEGIKPLAPDLRSVKDLEAANSARIPFMLCTSCLTAIANGFAVTPRSL